MARRFGPFYLSILLACIACEEPSDSEPPVAMDADVADTPDAESMDAPPDADAGTPIDAGFDPVDTGLRVRAAHLSPAAGTSTGTQVRFRGGLAPSTRPPSESASHRLTGGLIPSRVSR